MRPASWHRGASLYSPSICGHPGRHLKGTHGGRVSWPARRRPREWRCASPSARYDSRWGSCFIPVAISRITGSFDTYAGLMVAGAWLSLVLDSRWRGEANLDRMGRANRGHRLDRNSPARVAPTRILDRFPVALRTMASGGTGRGTEPLRQQSRPRSGAGSARRSSRQA